MQEKKQQLELGMEQQTGPKFGKEYVKAKYYHPACFNLHAGYIMWNPGLDESQAGIKIASRNIINLRYADDTTLMAKSEEYISLLMMVKEENGKAGLKLGIQTMKIIASRPIISWQVDGKNVETVSDFIFLGSKISADDCSHKIKRCLLLGRTAMTHLDSVLKSRGISLLTKLHTVKAMLFSSGHV